MTGMWPFVILWTTWSSWGPGICWLMVANSWLLAFLNSVIHTSYTMHFPSAWPENQAPPLWDPTLAEIGLCRYSRYEFMVYVSGSVFSCLPCWRPCLLYVCPSCCPPHVLRRGKAESPLHMFFTWLWWECTMELPCLWRPAQLPPQSPTGQHPLCILHYHYSSTEPSHL